MGHAKENAGAPESIQNTDGAINSYFGYCNLFIHDGVPANGYLDPFISMDADRPGYLFILWGQEQPFG